MNKLVIKYDTTECVYLFEVRNDEYLLDAFCGRRIREKAFAIITTFYHYNITNVEWHTDRQFGYSDLSLICDVCGIELIYTGDKEI